RGRQPVDIASQADDRLAFAPPGDPAGRQSGDFALDLEAVLFENLGNIFGRLELVKCQFPEAEDRIVDLLRQLAAAIDACGDLLLQSIKIDLRILSEAGAAQHY